MYSDAYNIGSEFENTYWLITRISPIVFFFLLRAWQAFKGGVEDARARWEKGNFPVLSSVCIPSSLSPAWQALKGGKEGGIRACEITGGERELPRSLECPHSLFPFPCMIGA